MASKWYPLGLKKVLDGDAALDTNIKVMLTNSTQTYSNAHDFLDDVNTNRISGTTDIATTNEVTSVAGAVIKWDCDDTGLTWSAVAGGSTVGSVIFYYDTGSAATSPLLVFSDVTDTATNGGDITITINASGIGTIDTT